MAVTPDGILYLIGLDASIAASSPSRRCAGSLDPSTAFTTTQVNLGGQIGGFGGPNPVGLLGQPWIAVDPSDGASAGYIYVVGSVDPTGPDPMNVNFIRSTNEGLTWSAPVRLNDDAGTSAWQWFGTMSVAPNGRIDVVWNDTRHAGLENVSGYSTRSRTDGGLSWSANEQLSPSWDSFLGWPARTRSAITIMTSDLVGANLAWRLRSTASKTSTTCASATTTAAAAGSEMPSICQWRQSGRRSEWHPDECESSAAGVAEQGAGAARLDNRPNPFHRSAVIRFNLPPEADSSNSRSSMLRGQVVAGFSTPSGRRPEQVTWDGGDDQEDHCRRGLLLSIECPGIGGLRGPCSFVEGSRTGEGSTVRIIENRPGLFSRRSERPELADKLLDRITKAGQSFASSRRSSSVESRVPLPACAHHVP
jgi:hypothetical protein